MTQRHKRRSSFTLGRQASRFCMVRVNRTWMQDNTRIASAQNIAIFGQSPLCSKCLKSLWIDPNQQFLHVHSRLAHATSAGRLNGTVWRNCNAIWHHRPCTFSVWGTPGVRRTALCGRWYLAVQRAWSVCCLSVDLSSFLPQVSRVLQAPSAEPRLRHNVVCSTPMRVS